MTLEVEGRLTVAEIAAVFGGRVLRLDSFKNKWNNPLDVDGCVEDLRECEAEDRCPNSRRYARFIVEGKGGETRVRFVYLRCKSWSCPYCARVNSQVLYMRVKRGIVGCLESVRRDGFRDEYYVKFLTLTLPGQEWRDQNDRTDAEQQLKYSFKKMVYQLRRQVGHFEYVWVVEAQRDGFAHLHVALVGEGIAPANIKGKIEKLWRDQQGMGFIKLNVAKGGINSIASYLSKYMTKGLKSGFKGSHIYGASSGFHAASKREKPEITLIEIGNFTFEDGRYVFTPMWQMHNSMNLEQQREVQNIEQEEGEDLWYQMLLPFG